MSVLQDMTKGIMNTKATKAAQLTPVVGEAMTSVEQAALLIAGANAPFPFDQLSQTMMGVAAQLRREAATLIEAAEHIESAANIGPAHPNFVPQDAPVPQDVEQPVDVERRTPTETFNKRMKRLTEEAKAQVFVGNDDGAEDLPVVSVTNVDGWVCPTHGDAAILNLKTRAGNAYRVCDACDAVEPRK